MDIWPLLGWCHVYTGGDVNLLCDQHLIDPGCLRSFIKSLNVPLKWAIFKDKGFFFLISVAQDPL